MARCADTWFSFRSRAPSAVTLPCRFASLAPVPMAALNVFAGVMRFPVKTRTTSDAGNSVPTTPLRTFARSLMLACTASRACTVPGWYPAATVTPEESLMTAFAALSVAACACLSSTGRGALVGRVVALVAAYATEMRRVRPPAPG